MPFVAHINILHKRYCCGRGPGFGRPCGESGGTPPSAFAVGEQASSPSLRRAARRTFTKSSAEIHLIPAPYASAFRTAASHIASDGQCTRPLRPSLSLPLAASRQFILHDANQAFVLIYAAVHSSARAGPRGHWPPNHRSRSSTTEMPSSSWALLLLLMQWRVSPTDFYGGLLPSHSYILR